MKARQKSVTKYYVWMRDKGKPEAIGFKMFAVGTFVGEKQGDESNMLFLF